MNERDNTPDKLIALKEAIMTAFHALPPEHQATMNLVILGQVVEAEWGDWTLDAISRLYPPQETSNMVVLQFPTVTREQLRQVGFSSHEVNTLTDDELTAITSDMYNHYVHDLFWDELQFHADNHLAAKRSKTDK